MTSFTWLHLTDLHLGMGPDRWLWPEMEQEFFDDLGRHHGDSGPWDLVLFTGDLVQRGDAQEFAEVDELLARMWERLQQLGSQPVLLAVPGNHDIMRPDRTKRLEVKALREWQLDAESRQEFWGEPDGRLRDVVDSALAGYTTWWASQPFRCRKGLRDGLLPGEFSVTLEKEGARLGIVGLNTTFLQLDAGDYQGNLAIDPRQFHEACGGNGPAWAEAHDACLLLTHHGPEWLDRDSLGYLRGEIYRPGRFVAHLYGHMHEASTSVRAEGGGIPRRFWQGRALFGLERWGEGSEKTSREHGYMAGRLDLQEESLRVRLWPRTAVRKQAGYLGFGPDLSFELQNDGGLAPEEIPRRSPRPPLKPVAPIEASPEPKGPAPRMAGLPEPLTSFVGRAQELEKLHELLLTTRLLTLIGPGGSGKTRLAQQLAREVEGSFEHGLCWIPLAAISDPVLVMPTIGLALGIHSDDEGLLATMKEHLQNQELLLVLDNLEQVAAAAATAIGELLSNFPRLKIVATSREVLRVSGEQLYEVPPMTLPELRSLPSVDQLTGYEAVALFTTRVKEVRPGFALTPENAAAVVEICHRLDGLPLAIELVSRRIQKREPEELLKLMGSVLPILPEGPRNLPERQRTLRAAISWSYRLLEEEERLLLQRVSVFVGGCTLPAATEVCGAEGGADMRILDGLDSLVDQSLLRSVPQDGLLSRYRMLHTIREFAREHLVETGEEATVRERHVQFFLELAEDAEKQLEGRERDQWLQQLEVEHHNLRAALEWLATHDSTGRAESALRLGAALWRFWRSRGHRREGFQWLQRILEVSTTAGDTPLHARVLIAAGALAHDQAEFDRAEAFLRQGLAVSRACEDHECVAEALNHLGIVSADRGDLEQARQHFEDALALQRQLGASSGISRLLNNLGKLARDRGDFLESEKLYSECLRLARARSDSRGIAIALNNLGDAAIFLGATDRAERSLKESLQINRDLGDPWGIRESLNGLARLALDRDRLTDAVALLRESLGIGDCSEDPLTCVIDLELVAHVLAALGHRSEAARLYKSMETWREVAGSRMLDVERAEYESRKETAMAGVDEQELGVAGENEPDVSLDEATRYALDLLV